MHYTLFKGNLDACCNHVVIKWHTGIDCGDVAANAVTIEANELHWTHIKASHVVTNVRVGSFSPKGCQGLLCYPHEVATMN